MSSPSITQSSGRPTIASAPTSIALFIGWAPSGPTDKAVGVSSFAEYESAFWKLDDVRSLLGYALGHFFDNGGKHAQVLRIVGANGEAIVPADRAFTQALSAACAAGGPVDKVDIFNLVCVPGLANAATIAMLQAKAAARRALLIADCAETATVASISASLAAITGANAANSALYFPWVLAPDQLRDNVSRAFPPVGSSRVSMRALTPRAACGRNRPALKPVSPAQKT
jgi:hypothetical protein